MAALLSVQNVSRSFGGLQAVNSVSFDVDPGEILGVIGPNGAGKSTLFNMIAGQEKPDRGSIDFDANRVTNMPAQALARRGLVKTFQTSRPFGSMTFLENVMVAALSHAAGISAARQIAIDRLEMVGLAARADAPAAWASTGQRKRLDIARALATEPRLLLLDEPFGGVDLPSVDALVDLLQRVRRSGVTLLVIEHNIEAMHRLVDRLVVMHLGRLILSGSAEEVTRDPRVVEAYLGTGEVAHA